MEKYKLRVEKHCRKMAILYYGTKELFGDLMDADVEWIVHEQHETIKD